MADNHARLNLFADEFDRAWQQGNRPSIRNFLTRVEATERTELVMLLIPIDAEYRRRAGEAVRAEDYDGLIEGGSSVVEELLKEIAENIKSRSVTDPNKTYDTPGEPGLNPDPAQRPQSSPFGPARSQFIGPYKLLQKLGEGGMGEVWIAEQTEPVKRRVAIKLIKPGFSSKEVLARFEAERQALALMNHPNIARILDAGSTPDGRPYFAMELVTGSPLTVYCDNNGLSINERLELIADVCNGVQHAHQKGIIHRDLKPSNVLVAMVDGKPVPKVIDFGLAKAMESTQRLTDKSVFTEFGQVVGTLKYMSPEQAGLNAIDIDTRTDIYALGIILYELLTGSTPLDDVSLKQQAVIRILEFIRESDPVKPSRRLESSTNEQRSAITQRRKTDSVRLNHILAGDLDWIVMKALEKDRTRRYESASGFAADVRRYLNNEPVVARPPSLNYRVRKFVRKNRVGVIAASLVLLALIGGIIGTGLGLWEAKRQETIAKQELVAKEAALAEEARQRKEAILAKEESEKRRQEAETNLAFARKGNEILGSVFADLDPEAEYSEVSDLRNALRDNLEKAVEQLEGSAIGDPLEVATMQNTLGLSLLGLGEFTQAITLFERARNTRQDKLGPDHRDTLTSMGNLAMGYQDAGQLDKALPLYEESLALMKSKLGLDHPDTLISMNNLAFGYNADGQLDKALPLLEETLALMKSKHGPDHSETLASMSNLAFAYKAAGQLDKALPLHEETLALMKSKLGPDHPDTLTSMNNLADAYRTAGQLEKALPLLEETLALKKSKLGPDHPNTLDSMNNLAGGYRAAGRLDKALPLLEQNLALLKSKLGSDHPKTVATMSNLAVAYKDAGQLGKALPLLEETLDLMKSKLGPDHPNTLISMGNLATGYQDAGQLDKALPLYEETLALRKSKLGPDHPNTLTSMANLASGYQDSGQLDKALPLFEETLALRKDKLGPDHPSALISMNNLAMGYLETGQLDKALPLFEETLALRKSKLGPDHPDTLISIGNLARGYQNAGQLDKALALFEETLALIKIKLGPDHPATLTSMNNLGVAYGLAGKQELAEVMFREFVEANRKKFPEGDPRLAGALIGVSLELLKCNQFSAAEEMIREGLAIREAKEPDVWTTFNTVSMLGGALVGQQKNAEAEPLLIRGYEGLKAREQQIPPQGATRIPEALDRLIELYTALEKPEEVKKYQELRKQFPQNE